MTKKITFLLGLGLSFFILLDYALGLAAALPKRAITLALCMAIVFLSSEEEKNDQGTSSKISKLISIIMLISGVVACLYAAIFWWDMAFRATLPTILDTVFAVMLIVAVFEGCRRKMGLAMPLVCLGFVVFGFLGNYIPGHWGHQGFTIQRFVDMIFMHADDGFWGSPMRVAVDMVIIFIIYGSMLQKLGGGAFFLDFSNALVGHFRGGPAKVAVISSALFGMISGSPVANVVATGTFTIPLMIKNGYKPQFSASVAAMASTGGSIMPPIMGAAAFLMADNLGMPYSEVAIAAIVPATIYYISLLVTVHYTAIRDDLFGIPAEEIPDLKTVIAKGWQFLISPILLVYLMVVKKYSVGLAGLLSIIAMIIVYFVDMILKKGGIEDIKNGVRTVIDAFSDGGTSSAGITVSFAITGLIIGVLGVTGLGLKLAGLLVDVAGSNLLLLAILTAIASILLGLGLPVSASYLIVAVTAAPALTSVGVSPLAAHFFVLYYAVLGVVTPPEAMASFAAAGIAGSNPFKTSIEAMFLGSTIFIMPFFFLINPALLLEGTAFEIIKAIIFGILAGCAISISFVGYFTSKLNVIQRAILFATAFLLLHSNLLINVAGLVIIGIVLVWSKVSSKKESNKSV